MLFIWICVKKAVPLLPIFNIIHLNSILFMKKVLYLTYLVTALCLLTGCDKKSESRDSEDFNTEGGTSYSGYAPNAKTLVGKWICGPSFNFDFLWDGSSWQVREGMILRITKPKDLKIVGGQINYTLVDGYTAKFQWTINYTYTLKVSHWKSDGFNSGEYYTYEDRSGTDSGDMTLCFTSYDGGYCKGTINGEYTSYQEFSLR